MRKRKRKKLGVAAAVPITISKRRSSGRRTKRTRRREGLVMSLKEEQEWQQLWNSVRLS